MLRCRVVAHHSCGAALFSHLSFFILSSFALPFIVLSLVLSPFLLLSLSPPLPHRVAANDQFQKREERDIPSQSKPLWNRFLRALYSPTGSEPQRWATLMAYTRTALDPLRLALWRPPGEGEPAENRIGGAGEGREVVNRFGTAKVGGGMNGGIQLLQC